MQRRNVAIGMMDFGIDFKGLDLENTDDRIHKLRFVIRSFLLKIDIEKMFSEM